ncbi:MAG: BatA domain-containing protein [Phycisphaeraceae bacterium]
MVNVLAQVIPSFVVPGLAIAGAAAVSVPILIHILSKRPRRPQPWAAMKFLLAAYQRHRMRTRLEQWILLATRCLLLLLLGLALAGPVFAALGGLGAFGGAQRTVVLVLDNAITSQATDADGVKRFEKLKAEAVALLEGLQPTDQVALVTVAKPSEAVVSPAAADPMSVRRQVEMVEASAGAAELSGALQLAMRALSDSDAQPEHAYVVVLSDFSAGAISLEEGLPAEVMGIGQMATLLMSEPAEGAINVNLSQLRPDRRLVVAEGTDSQINVTWTVGLKRFASADQLGPATSLVRLEVPDAAPIRREVSWEQGQDEAELRIDTPLARGVDGLLAVKGSIEPAAGQDDALPVDNQRWSLIQARDQLNVLVLGRRDADRQGFGPQRWLRTVLAPVGDQLGWPIEIREQDAATMGGGEDDLRSVDAVYVIRPDLLDDAAWDELIDWIRQGGLAWFAPPAEPTAALWPQRLSDALGLGWAIDTDPVVHETPLRLDPDAGADSVELARLSADLTDLLRPVEVYQRLAIDPDSLGGGTEILLRGTGGEPLLIGATSEDGQGRVLLLATALDSEWTNLPTKPLFVPLIHEVLRAGIDRLQPEDAFEPGDRPILSGNWARAGRMIGPDDVELLLVEAADPGTEAGETPQAAGQQSAGVMPIRPMALPGVYQAATDAVVVNVNSAAANTRAIERDALDAWLSELGEWQVIEQTEGVATLGADANRADLSWPLLWIVAVLALIEMTLARYVSHASDVRRSMDITAIGGTRQPA